MITDALQDVPDIFGVEETNREFHQFGQKIGNQGNADSCVCMQGDPALDKPHSRLSNRKYQLGNQNQSNKRQIIVADTLIDDSLCEKRCNQGKDAPEDHSDDNLNILRLVGKQVAKKVAQIFFPFFFIVFIIIEIGGRLQQQCRSRVFPVAFRAVPASAEFFPVHYVFFSCGIGDEEPHPLTPSPLERAGGEVIQHHEMILIPVQNAGQGSIFRQLFERNSYALRMHADAFGGIADPQHGNAFTSNETPIPQGLQGIAASVMLGDHAQAGGAAVHGVELGVMGKGFFHQLIFSAYFLIFPDLSYPVHQTVRKNRQDLPNKRWE